MTRILPTGLLLALLFAACGSESAPTAHNDSSPATPLISEPTGTSDSVSTDPARTDATSLPVESPTGLPVGQVLQRYEAAAVERSDGYWISYTLDCWTPPVLRGADWPPPIDRQQVVRRGSVVECAPRTDPPADTTGLWLIVLDDEGTATSWGEATDGTGAPPIAYERPRDLLCREYIALPAFAESMAGLGEPPWTDDKIAYQFVLAYWFLAGQPSPMDADGNGVPCELLFDSSIVAEVWSGDF